MLLSASIRSEGEHPLGKRKTFRFVPLEIAVLRGFNLGFSFLTPGGESYMFRVQGSVHIRGN
jgi:hypothetical protein